MSEAVRKIKKQFWFSRAESQDLRKKAKRTGFTEAALVRLLVKGYEPKELPDAQFYDAMRELSVIGNNIQQLAAKANALNFIDAPMLERESKKWHQFQLEIERKYLRPEKRTKPWR